MSYTRIALFVCIVLFSLFTFPANAADIPRAINYQGKLYDGGGPASGTYDFQVALYDASTGGTELWVKSFDDVSVSYGLFSLVLDNSDGGTNIGQILTQNADLWVEVRVRPGSSTGSYTVLGSREKLLASPWAITIADGAINEDKIDWGTGSGQVSADDVPFSADDVGWGGSPPTDVDAGLEDLVNRVSTLESGSGNYVQLSPGSAQNDADATSSIWINKTAASGNLMELEVSTTDQFVVDHSGNVSMAGDLTVSGNDISGGASGQLYIRSNGSVRVDLDDDGGGSESFKVANGSDNIVFEVTEGGNVSADGNADFSGNLTLSGSSGRSINGPTDAGLSVISETNLNLYIDGDDATGSVNSSALRVYRDQPGSETEVFEVTEGGNITVHGDINITDGTNTGTLTTSLTGNHTWTLPDASGTIALTSDLEDNYADGVSFNDGTNTLTITRTGTLSDLTTTIPVENDDLSDNQLTELSDVNTSGVSAGDVLKYDGSQWVADTDNEGVSGSGSAGQVAYFTGTSTVGGMNSLFWDSSNERLGLGTNNPMYRLDVRYTGEKVMRLGSETGNDLTIDIAAGPGLANIVAGATWDATDSRYEYTGTRGASRIRLHDGDITLYVGGTSGTAGNPVTFTTGLNINSSGNVGIKGNASTGDALYVYGSGHFTGNLTIGSYTLPTSDGSSGQVLMTDGAGNVSWSSVPGDNWGSQVVQHDGTLTGDGTSANPLSVVNIPGGDNDYIQNRAPDGTFTSGQSADFDITGSGELGGNLAVSGSVGIGVASASQKLEVSGNVLATAFKGTGNYTSTWAGWGNSIWLERSGHDGIFYVDPSSNIGFMIGFHANNNRIYIGHTTDGWTNGTYLLTIDGSTGNLDMNSHRIVNLASPTNNSDAATKAYVDAHTDGDADATNELQDLNSVLSRGNDANNQNIANVNSLTINDPGAGEGISWNSTSAGWTIDVSPTDRSNADGNLNIYGTANNVVIWRPLDMRSNAITNVADPSNAQDAATKSYVDGVAPQDDLSDNVLNDLSDVSASSPSNGQVLTWNGSAWIPQDPSGGVNGSGTSNYVPKWTGATTLGNSQVYDNGTNVGIGTTSPAQKLDVNGNIKMNDRLYFGNWLLGASGAWPSGPGFQYSGGDVTFGFSSTGGQVSIQIDGGFRQQETGKVNYFMDNVGIGTTSPSQKLHVAGNALVTGNTYFGDADAYIYQDGSNNMMLRDPNTNGGTAVSLSELFGAGGQGGDMGRTMNSNWNFEDGTKHWANWSGTGTVVTVTDGIMGAKAWQNNGSSVVNWMYSEEMIPIDPNKQYVVEVYARTVSGSVGRFYLAVILRDANGNNISGDGTWWYYPVNVNNVPTTWTRYRGIFGYGTPKPFPSNARYMQIGAILNYDYGSGHDRIQQIQGLRVYEINSEVLVVNPRSSAPGGAPEGMVYYNSSNHKMYYYNGSSWVDMSGGTSVWQDAGSYIYPSTATSFHIEDDGDLDLGGHNIERVNEISANNIDPVLKIGGKLYRTWTLDMVGQRTEVVGQAKLNSDGVWMVDLATQPKASDLWLFWHAVDQKTIIPFVTPQGPVQLYAYLEGSKFFVKSIDGTGNVRFSYRLIGVRYDFRDMTPEETNIRTKPTDTYIDIDAGQRYGE